MTQTEQLLLILGMAVVTAIPRVLPLVLLSSRPLAAPFLRWLEMIPPAVLAALLASELLLVKTEAGATLFFSTDNVFLLAALPTALAGWVTKNFFATVAVGMGTVALLRYCFL